MRFGGLKGLVEASGFAALFIACAPGTCTAAAAAFKGLDTSTAPIWPFAQKRHQRRHSSVGSPNSGLQINTYLNILPLRQGALL